MHTSVVSTGLWVFVALSASVCTVRRVVYPPAPADAQRIVTAFYAAISAEKGEKDWQALRALCLPAAHFNAMGINEQGSNEFYPQTMEQYVEHLTPYIREYGFLVRETSRRTEYYEKIAHVWSAYESRNAAGGPVIDRGYYSFQLVQVDGQWKIAGVLWNSAPQRE
jgi:hypothetical protein